MPSASQRTRSPVRYRRAPGSALKGSGTKRSAVSSGPAQVAARQALAADEQLAGHAHGHRLQVRVQHVQPARWPAAGRWDGRRRRAAAPAQAVAYDGGLGGAVDVEELRVRGAARQLAPQRLGAAASPPTTSSARSARGSQQARPRTSSAQQRRRAVQHVDARAAAASRSSASGSWRAASAARRTGSAPSSSVHELLQTEASKASGALS